MIDAGVTGRVRAYRPPHAMATKAASAAARVRSLIEGSWMVLRRLSIPAVPIV
jgi:hypothetical protein